MNEVALNREIAEFSILALLNSHMTTVEMILNHLDDDLPETTRAALKDHTRAVLRLMETLEASS